MTCKTVLGIDASTQSMSAVLLDSATGELLWRHSLAYREDPRLFGLGFEHDTMIIPPREPGEAEQPYRLFLAALDALFCDLKAAGIITSSIVAINTSAQQHGHVYLNARARTGFSRLQELSSVSQNLATLLADCFAYGGAPIWKTSNTETEAAHIRAAVGGSATMIQRTGSDIPLRFSANIYRKVACRYPDAFTATRHIMQISSLIPALLAGDCTVPIDFANACGTGLMNYQARVWDDAVVRAVASDLPGGSIALLAKLPSISHPLAVCGTVAAYFQKKYGLSERCRVIVGSGDNPQSKVLASGDLLSLGTSFVYMMPNPIGEVDVTGMVNSMYDGLGRPFFFACRSNGALAWDQLRVKHGLGVKDYVACESALSEIAPGALLRFWHPDTESFPPMSPKSEPVRLDQGVVSFSGDFSAVVDSSLGLIYRYSRKIVGCNKATAQEPMIVCGGASSSPRIMNRIAAIWNRPVIQAGDAGAALGAAVAAAAAFIPEKKRDAILEKLRRATFFGKAVFTPNPQLVCAYHAPDCYLDQLENSFEKLCLDGHSTLL